MSFNPYAHGPVRWYKNPRVLPKGAAVVVEFDNGDRVKAWVLQKGNFGQIHVTTDPFRILHPNTPEWHWGECFTVNWWQYEALRRSHWVRTRPRSSRVLAQVAARRDADRRANE